jgi:threonylcarbamoyladenosine tRNA methylthiotransferase MtaB
MPDAFIGVDVIVGTRGETDEYFEDAYRFIKSLDISQLHVFSYSERPGTKALEIPHVVSPAVKHERSKRLLDLSEEKRKAFYEKYIGTERPVLWEHAKAGMPLQGFTDNYIRVTEAEGCKAVDNIITTVKLKGFAEDTESLMAEA